MTDPAATGAPRKRRPIWRRCVGWFVAFLALMVLLMVGAYYWRVRTLEARIEEAVAALDRDCPGWRLADVVAAREPVSDDKNGALIVLKAHQLLPKDFLDR